MPSVKDKRISEFRTICQVHRDMYDLVLHEDMDDNITNKIIELLDEAYNMAKKMNNKLSQYKYKFDDDWCKQQPTEKLERNSKEKNK